MDEFDDKITIVASFPSREAANKTAHALHRDGMHTWIGVTHGAQTSQRAAERNPIMRWFHRDSDRTLYDVLREHGVEEEDALLVDGTIVEGDAVLVAEGMDPVEIEREVTAHGGTVRSALIEDDASGDDPLAASRMVAAERHPAGDAADRTIEDAPPVAVVREEFFVLRDD
ncbi:MAG TPA: hypothetical protein VMD91_11500 [Candidatus Sulfotelmatobacter sp.]|nr:hypothetical protein [Candidatus Sulfotelmatobacter sp.]